jgi:PAS domain S-box-containing protein
LIERAVKNKTKGLKCVSGTSTAATDGIQSQTSYGQILEYVTEYAVFAISPAGIVLSWNVGGEKIFGYKAAEIIGRPFEIIFTLDDQAAGAPQNEIAAALSGTEKQHDRWHVRKDTTRFWGTNSIEPLVDASQKVIGFTKLVRDSTIDHLANQKLSDSEQRLRLLFESIEGYAIYTLALDATVESWNAGAVELFGFESNDIVGQDFSMLFSADDRALAMPSRLLENARTPGLTTVDCWMMRKDGSRFFGSGKINQLKRDIAGNLRGYVMITHDMTELRAALEHERNWSTTFQRAVLPATLPQITGLSSDAVYEPGSKDAQVGGDWYDAVRLSDGRILVAIGDVSGHGLEAAVIVGVIRQIVRGIAQLHADPAVILDAADQALSSEYPEVYVTAWVAVLDPVTRTITYSCAGHPPALLIEKNGSLRELDGAPGLPIGLREGVLGLSQTVSWADGDTLVLYTDGLIEAKRDILAGIAMLREAALQLGTQAWQNPADRLRRALTPDGSPDDVAVLVLRMDFGAFEEKVDRWQLDAKNALAATRLRKKFAASLPDRSFSLVDIANAELVFGELISNVLRHTSGNSHTDIAVDHSGPRTVLHVMDSGTGFRYISRLAPEPYSENGRGLFLIAVMTTDFHVDRRPNGGSHARAVLRDRSSVSVF